MPRGKKETAERATFWFAEPGKANRKKNRPCTRQVENVMTGRKENVQETNRHFAETKHFGCCAAEIKTW